MRYLKPGHAWRRAATGPGYAARIKKQDATASFMARNVRVPVQENIDIIRRMIRRKMLQLEFQSAAHKINDKRPLEIAVAISPHKRDARSDRPQLVKNRFHADIAKMPDFISAVGHFLYAVRQTIVCVGQNEDTQHASRFVHIFKRKFECFTN
jgi:hypothetical protein